MNNYYNINAKDFFEGTKYGDFKGERNGRYFCDLTEQKAESIFTDLGFKVEKMWIMGDVQSERKDELWINIPSKNIEYYCVTN